MLSRQKEAKAVDAALDLLIVIVSRPELNHSMVEDGLDKGLGTPGVKESVQGGPQLFLD